MKKQEETTAGTRKYKEAKMGPSSQTGQVEQAVDSPNKPLGEAPLHHVNPLTSAEAVVAQDKGVILTLSIHARGFLKGRLLRKRHDGWRLTSGTEEL